MESEKEVFNFENLDVYQKSLTFVNQIYNITDKFPRQERFTTVDQFRRAAISISLNIAEGYGGTQYEFKRYLNIARCSARECIALISISKTRKLIDDKKEKELRKDCSELSKMISGLIRSLKINSSRSVTPNSELLTPNS